MRWPIAIAVGFAILFVVDATFIYIAATGDDPVDPSYVQEAR